MSTKGLVMKGSTPESQQTQPLSCRRGVRSLSGRGPPDARVAPPTALTSRARVHRCTVSEAISVSAPPAAADLSVLWDAHVATEFTTKDPDAAVSTMVPHATVNHVPTLTGGVGTEMLRSFYAEHFISKMPADTKIMPIARTVGSSSVVDEMIFEFTHDVQMDWMLPRVPPTHRKVAIPIIVSVAFEGEKLAAERIYWDQASVLVQLGILDPSTLPGNAVSGVEQAEKVLDVNAAPSNQQIHGAML